MQPARLQRLVKLIGLLQSSRGHDSLDLARATGVSRRTIFRDLDVLKQAGVPLVYNETLLRYHIPNTYYLPPTNFTYEEALSVAVLCHELGDKEQLPFFQHARTAVLKLEGALTEELREQLQRTIPAISIRLPPSNQLDGQQRHYEQILDSIVQRQAVRVVYGSLTEWEDIRTKLSPYCLWHSRRSWYVIGRSSWHRAVRTFNLGRIKSLESTKDTFPVPKGFSVERYHRNAWHMMPGKEYQVWIRFQKMMAQNVAEVRWHPTQETRHNPDGTLDFFAKVSGLHEICWWILGYGDRAEVIEPPELRALIAQHAKNLYQMYQRRASKKGGPPAPHFPVKKKSPSRKSSRNSNVRRKRKP